MTMGEIITTLRKQKGMTQKDLAEQLHITDKAVSKWERNVAYPDTGTIPKLAGILGVSVEELMNAKNCAGNRTSRCGVSYKPDTQDCSACHGHSSGCNGFIRRIGHKIRIYDAWDRVGL